MGEEKIPKSPLKIPLIKNLRILLCSSARAQCRVDLMPPSTQGWLLLGSRCPGQQGPGLPSVRKGQAWGKEAQDSNSWGPLGSPEPRKLSLHSDVSRAQLREVGQADRWLLSVPMWWEGP